jgi:hypothetical protein
MIWRVQVKEGPWTTVCSGANVRHSCDHGTSERRRKVRFTGELGISGEIRGRTQ